MRFHAIVGVGNVTGPYRGGLFYWKTTRKDAVDAVATALWPYLGAAKRAQFEAMTVAARRGLPPLPPAKRTCQTELAWAAGLFDGEGSIVIRRTGSGQRTNLEVSQASGEGMPETLIRFREAVAAGWLNGHIHPAARGRGGRFIDGRSAAATRWSGSSRSYGVPLDRASRESDRLAATGN